MPCHFRREKWRKPRSLTSLHTSQNTATVWAKPFEPDISDIGIVVSRDPVAVEKATIDLINEHTGKDYFKHIWPEIDYTVQLNHAHEIGLGNLEYDLENVIVG